MSTAMKSLLLIAFINLMIVIITLTPGRDLDARHKSLAGSAIMSTPWSMPNFTIGHFAVAGRCPAPKSFVKNGRIKILNKAGYDTDKKSGDRVVRRTLRSIDTLVSWIRMPRLWLTNIWHAWTDKRGIEWSNHYFLALNTETITDSQLLTVGAMIGHNRIVLYKTYKDTRRILDSYEQDFLGAWKEWLFIQAIVAFILYPKEISKIMLLLAIGLVLASTSLVCLKAILLTSMLGLKLSYHLMMGFCMYSVQILVASSLYLFLSISQEYF